jgi:hypothetical protein
MSIEAILREERQRYVNFFAEVKAKLQADLPDAVGEPLITFNRKGSGCIYPYYRPDVVSKNDGGDKLHEIRLGANPSFEAVSFAGDGFQVDIHPFAWSDIQVIFDKPPTDAQQIEDWFTRWVDADDLGGAAQNSLSGAVHTFSPAEQHGLLWMLIGDLGTAPADALVELIELLIAQGMSHIVLAST